MNPSALPPYQSSITFSESGTNLIESIRYEKTDNKFGRVYINENQYFDNIPESAFNFYIGGYQPAQKWLKDRKGDIMTFDDGKHYKNIIYALHETINIMISIDKIVKLS
jgi:hypothetical protein